MSRGPADRIIDIIERTAAVFLAAVTALMFVSVFLRYFFAWAVPDNHDLGCLMLGILIFWGLAGAGYRGDHITVDLLWTICPSQLRRAVDLFANAVSLTSVAVFTWMMGTKVMSTRLEGVATYDTQMPVWIFYLVAWSGLVASTLLMALRLAQFAVRPQMLASSRHPISE